MSVLHLDWETRSTVDIKEAGAYPYAAHPTTDILCAAYAFDDEPVQLWTPDQAVPFDIVSHVLAGGEVHAHNAQFERLIWRHIATPKYGWPEPKMEQFVCTAAMAAAMSLPRHLDGLAKAIGLDVEKDKVGYNLMLRLSRPRKINEDGTIVWWGDDPKDKPKLERLYAYCKQDVVVERRAEKSMRPLTPHEREIYLLDQRVNDRGVKVDMPLVLAAQEVADIGIERANVVLRQYTAGAVPAVTDHKALTRWLQEQGVDTDSVAKPAVAEMLSRDDLSEQVRIALEQRAEAGRTSIAKLKSFVAVTMADGRARGLLLYHAASTGRWGGKLLQPHNFTRGEVEGIEAYIPLVMQKAYDLIALMLSPIIVVSSMLRSMLTAGEGNDLLVADYSGIEARVVNWLAGQEDVLALFRKFDETHDKQYEPYTVNATKLYNIPFEQVQKFPHRQLGKAQELGCGFGMGSKKFVTSAKEVYGLTLTEPESERAVDQYRATHKMVKAFWYETEDAVREAITVPNVPIRFGDKGRLKAIVAGAYLYIILPSGRPLVYPAPRIVMAPPPWGGEDKPQIEFSAVNAKTHQWNRERTYGGKLVENITQAVARDLMADAMLRAEARGYTPVLSVHDEVVAEVPKGFGSVKEFEAIMCELPAWADGCPVAAEGWRGERYRK